MTDWIVLHPIEAGIISLPLAALYFVGVLLLERKLKKSPSKRIVNGLPIADYYTPMDIAPGERPVS